jgi:hypothetical protein
MGALWAACGAGCATGPGVKARPAVVPETLAGRLRDLDTLRDLTAAFDRDRAHPRLVLLLSPT